MFRNTWFFALTIFSLAAALPAAADENAPEMPGRCLARSGLSYLPNPRATIDVEPAYDSTQFPITTEWRDEVSITDSTWAFLHPAIVAGGSYLHVFGNGVEIGVPGIRPVHFRSIDDGDTWTLFGDYYNPDFTGQPEDVNAWGDGATLYACWRGEYGSQPAFVHFRSSPDHGATWPITAELRRAAPYDDARYGVVAGRGDTAFVNFIQYGAYSLTCWRTVNRGFSWTDPGWIDTAWGQSYPARMVYGGGVLHIAHNKDWEDQTDVFYLRSTDHGQSFAEPVFLGFPDGNHGQWPEIAADSLGSVAVCWMDYIGSPYAFVGGAWVRQSADYGATWGPAVRLDTNYEASVGMAVAVQANYRAVAWVDHSGPGSRVVLRESQNGGMSWGPAQVMGEGACYEPRLAVRGDTAYLVWLSSVYVGGDERRTIRFRKNDAAVGIGWSEEECLPLNSAVIAHPNPFNSWVSIEIKGSKGGDLKAEIFDLTGRKVKTLNSIGELKIIWDATDDSGKKVTSGIYFARIAASQRIFLSRLALVK
jgi:hypothetical protein